MLISLRFADRDDIPSFNGYWECSNCGIRHGHHPILHDLRELEFMPDTLIQDLEFNPECNCGIYEAAVKSRVLQEYSIDNEKSSSFEKLQDRIAVTKDVEREVERMFL